MTAPNIGSLQVQVQASFNRLARDIELRLAAIAKTQSIKLRVQVQEASLGRLNKQLKSFSGINALQRSFQNASEHVTGFFDNIGAVSRRVTLLGAAIGPVTAGLASLAPAVTALGTAAAGGLAAMPGLLAAAGASFFVFKTAFSDLPSTIQTTLDKFNGFKDLISGNFWSEATGEVNSFISSAVGPLREGFGQISTAAGTFTGTLASAFEKAFTPDVYEGFFQGITDGFAILSDGGFADAFAGISATLLEFGSSVIPIIAQGIENITVKFDKFLTANPDFLMNSFNTLVTVVQAVFSAVGSVVSIFGGLASAASAAGIGATNLTGPLGILADAINSVNGQRAITTFLADMMAGVEGLSWALEPLGALFANLAPIIGDFVATAGQTLGVVFEKLFTSLNRPEVLENISGLLQAMPQIFSNIAPSIDLIVDKISGLADIAATTVDELSQTLNSALQAILPAITPLFEPIKTLIGTIGETMRTVFAKIGPVLQSLAPAFASLIAVANDFMKALQNPAAQFIIDLILGFIKTAVNGFINLAKGVMKVVDGLLSILSGDFSGFSKIFSGLGDLIKGAFQLFITFFAPAKILGLLGRAFGGLVTKVLPGILRGLVGLIVKIPVIGVRMAGALLRGLLSLITKLPQLGGQLIQGLIRGVSAAIGGLLVWLTEHIWEPIKNFFGINSPSTLFAEMGGFLIDGLINGIKAVIGFLVDIFRPPLELIVGLFSTIFNGIGTVVSAVWTVIKAGFDIFVGLIQGGLNILAGIFSAVWEGIKVAGSFIWTVLSTAFEVYKTIIMTGIQIVLTVITTVWEAIKTAGAFVWTIIQGAFNLFMAGIQVGINIVMTVVNAVWTAIQTAGQFVWSIISTAFGLFMSGIQVGIGIVRTVVSAVWTAIKTAGSAVWTGIQAVFNVFKAGITAAINVIKTVITAVWTAIKTAGGAVWTAIQTVFNGFKSAITTAINAIKTTITNVWTAITSAGKAIWTGIQSAFNTFKTAISNGVSAIGGFFSGLGETILSPFRSAFNAIAGLWNNTIGSLSFTVPDWIPGIGGNTFSLPKIPTFATGTRNFAGGLAMVGERGPELVTLPRGSNVYTASESRKMLARDGNQGGDTYQIVVRVDVKDLEEMRTVGEFIEMMKKARVDARRTAGSGKVTA